MRLHRNTVFRVQVAWLTRRLICCILPLTSAWAEVHVAGVFGDHMVLQRDTKLPVWGTAAPGESVTVEFAGQKKQATAGKDGRWRLNLDPIAASATAADFSITGTSTPQVLRFQDVLVGEVWVCGGEANMERTLGLRAGQKPITNWKQEVAQAAHPTLRQLAVKPHAASSPQSAVDATWTVCSPETVSTFTAVGYFFARDLQQAIHVPVGIINASCSETPAEAWTSSAGLSEFPEFHNALAAAAAPSSDDLDHGNVRGHAELLTKKSSPTALFNGMIAPLIPYAIRGVAFYQGESNAERPEQYRALFPALIADWRQHWNQGDFPFLFVQVAPNLQSNPKLREAQLLTWQRTKNTAMIVTLDCGDIEDIHPPRKQPVGARLALAARAVAYHEPVEYSGPVYQSMTVEEDRAVLHFSHLAGGLAANNFSLMGFTMAGPDGIFHAAHGEIEGDTVVVTIPDVQKPDAVRYAWEKAPDGNLVNDAGLPASPFRTDVR